MKNDHKYLQLGEGMKATGFITIRSYNKGTIEKVMPLIEQLNSLAVHAAAAADLREEVKRIFSENYIGKVEQQNIVMQGTNTGIGLITQRMLGTNTYSLNVNYGAIGTGATAPAVSDTQLVAEVARTTVALGQSTGPTNASFQFFFTDASLTNQTYREFGVFIGASATPNSGQIFNRALFTSPYAKAMGTDTTVQVDFNFA